MVSQMSCFSRRTAMVRRRIPEGEERVSTREEERRGRLTSDVSSPHYVFVYYRLQIPIISSFDAIDGTEKLGLE